MLASYRAQEHGRDAVFAAVMGVSLPSTVPPTAGLVAKFYGPANMATLFGIVDGVAPARRLPRRLAGRQGLRGERQLRLDVDRRHPARRRVALLHLPIREKVLPPRAAPEPA